MIIKRNHGFRPVFVKFFPLEYFASYTLIAMQNKLIWDLIIIKKIRKEKTFLQLEKYKKQTHGAADLLFILGMIA